MTLTPPATWPKTTDLCDALPSVQVCHLPWRHHGRRRAFAGPAHTVHSPGDVELVRRSLLQPGEGRVLVVDGGGDLRLALLGDVLAGLAVRHGWAGVLVHGAIRDSDEIDAMDLGVKALGTVPCRAAKEGRGAVGVPLQLGGATVHPGDWVVADGDGVVVLPPGLRPEQVDTSAALAATAAYVAQPAG